MILSNLENKKLILASGSPRRQQLIRDLGLDVAVRLKPVDESYSDHLKREQVALYLAEKKADALLPELNEDEVLITGDTIVCLGDQILNKPKDAAEAFEMLTALSANTHSVITAVCIASLAKKEVFYDETTVTFRALTSAEIQHYINEFQPFDKAGGYGIQEWIGCIGIVDMCGSFYNVMGFPLHKIYEALSRF